MRWLITRPAAGSVVRGYGAPRSSQAELEHPQQRKICEDASRTGSRVDVLELREVRTSKHLTHDFYEKAHDIWLSNPLCSLEAVGLNRIFGHREDEVVPLDPEVAKGLGQEFKKPDAIFGLRQSMVFCLIRCLFEL